MNQSISKQQLFDYFAGKATALERQQIDEWVRDPAHEERFYVWLDEWEQTRLQYVADEPMARQQYHEFLFSNQSGQPDLIGPTNPMPVRALRTRWWVWAVAASVLLSVGLFGFRDPLLNRTYVTDYGQTRALRLDDGTAVVLNANSSLRVPRFGFGTHNRHVSLNGEATFSVVHLPHHERFIVHSLKGVDVVVLGTEFTVFTRPRQTKVVLAKGKVLVNYPTVAQQTGQVMLKPGDLITLDNRGQLRRAITRQPGDFAAWQRHRFVFDNTSLREVGQLLLENYGIRVQISDDSLARQTLTGSFHAETADELLRALSDVLGINVVRHNQEVLLTD